MFRVNLFAVLPFLLLALMIAFCAIPAHAGGPPQLWIGIPTGLIAPWGQERIESATAVVGEQFEAPFADGWFPYDGNVTYAAIESVHGGLPMSAKSGVSVMGQLWWVGYIWSGIGETRTEFQTAFSVADPRHEYQWDMEVYRPTDELNQPWTTATMFHGSHFYINMRSIKVSSLENWRDAYMVRIYATPVPEPSSVMALMTGFAGLGGFILRRRS